LGVRAAYNLKSITAGLSEGLPEGSLSVVSKMEQLSCSDPENAEKKHKCTSSVTKPKVKVQK